MRNVKNWYLFIIAAADVCDPNIIVSFFAVVRNNVICVASFNGLHLVY